MKRFRRYLYFLASLAILLCLGGVGIAFSRHNLFPASAAWIEIDYKNSRIQLISFVVRSGSRWRFEVIPASAAVAQSYCGDSRNARNSSGGLDKVKSRQLIDMIYHPLWASINMSSNYSIVSEWGDYIVATSRCHEVYAINKEFGLIAQYGVYPDYSSVFYLDFSSDQVKQIINSDLSRAVLLDLLQYLRSAKMAMRPGARVNLHGVVLLCKERIECNSATTIEYDFLEAIPNLFEH